MFAYAIVFFFVALLAGMLGFGGIAGTPATIAQVLCVVFLVLCGLTFLFRGRGRSAPGKTSPDLR
jgi:uncharacterized membrane protein YtjA (UPF0391 family)